MKFDKQKWDAYVQEQGGFESLAKKAMENKVISFIFDYNHVLDVIQSSFTPTTISDDVIIFLALNLNITDFILLEPVQIFSGIAALALLCNGKELKTISTDLFYMIEDHTLLERDTVDVWEPSDQSVHYFLNNDFEVIE
jgi:hypothetical protein